MGKCTVIFDGETGVIPAAVTRSPADCTFAVALGNRGPATVWRSGYENAVAVPSEVGTMPMISQGKTPLSIFSQLLPLEFDTKL